MCTGMGQRNRVQCFKDPRHKSFLYGGVGSFVCVHHDTGFYSYTGDWVNEIACLPREARVPEDWRETTSSLLPDHVTPGKTGNQKPKQPPWLRSPGNILLKIHQLTRKEVKRRANSTETSKFHFSEPMIRKLILAPKLYRSKCFYPISKPGIAELWLLQHKNNPQMFN